MKVWAADAEEATEGTYLVEPARPPTPLRRAALRRAALVAAGALLVGAAAFEGAFVGAAFEAARDAPPAGGAAVCVTGQLERFVQDSKLEHLVRPLADYYGRPVDVVFVLAQGRAVFVNSVDVVANDVTPRDVVETFEADARVGRVWFEDFEEPEAPVINERYAGMLRDDTREGREAHATDHARMLYHYALCGRRVAQLAAERGAEYDVLANAREDLYFLAPVDARAIADAVRPGIVATQNFEKNPRGGSVFAGGPAPYEGDAEGEPLGTNDKIIFYSFANLADVCDGPLDTMVTHFDYEDLVEAARYTEDAAAFMSDLDRNSPVKLAEYPYAVERRCSVSDCSFVLSSETFLDYTYRHRRGLANFRLPTTALAAVAYKLEEPTDEGGSPWVCLSARTKDEMCADIPDTCKNINQMYYMGHCTGDRDALATRVVLPGDRR